jgi:hypothetical protein
MIISILQHTPNWVWGLLAGLIVIGMKQTEGRLRSVRSATILPLAMSALSFYGVASVFVHQQVPLATWAAGAVAALCAFDALGVWRGIEWSNADRRLFVPGSWVPLTLLLTLFVLKFGVGVAVSLAPSLVYHADFAGLVGLAYGAFSGAFLARGLAMWRVIRQHQVAQRGAAYR